MRVVGIDPGLKTTGYGVVAVGGGALSLGEMGIVSTRQRDPLPDRIQKIYKDILALLEETGPEVAAVEKLYSHYAHPRTAILMAHARGAVMLAAANYGIPVASYSATMVKRSLTGNGHASKGQVQRMVEAVLGLKNPPEPDDVADALAVALCHLNAAERPAVAGRRGK